MGIFGQWTLWRNLVLLSDHECSPAILSLSRGNIGNVRITRDNWDKKVRLMDWHDQRLGVIISPSQALRTDVQCTICKNTNPNTNTNENTNTNKPAQRI